MLNGNIKSCLKIASWNCRRGLVLSDKTASSKITEIKNCLYSKGIHLFGVIEADIHNTKSRCINKQKLSTEDVRVILDIPGYKLVLPTSWNMHGQARIIMYAKDGVSVVFKENNKEYDDLQSISCEVSLNREKNCCKLLLQRIYWVRVRVKQ